MARPRKDGQYLNVKINTAIYNRLEKFCEESGYTKTAAVEKGLTALVDHYTSDQETLRRIANGSVTLVETGGSDIDGEYE